jgi:lipopolysaccharide/colanic/teichoic acid biosynthesis glycosyltransferase
VSEGVLRSFKTAVRRFLDVLVAALLLLLLFPVIAAVVLAIKLVDPGPAFYRCRRLGYRGRPFDMLKFRKMRGDASGLPLTVAGDARFTRVGRILAETKLDEIPQLWNVIKGEMSLVGPRPEDPQFVALCRNEYEEILQVRPGITGLSQLAFANEGRILDPADRVRHYVERVLPQKTSVDRLYVSRRSIWIDARILAWTAISTLLRQQVAVHRETGRLSLRRRPMVTGSAPHRSRGHDFGSARRDTRVPERMRTAHDMQKGPEA